MDSIEAETLGTEEMNKEIDLEADFIEEEDPSAYGVTVRAATLDKLAEFCLEEFGEYPSNNEFKPEVELAEVKNLEDENGPLTEEPLISNALFMTHRWFVPSEELFEKFVDLYNKYAKYSRRSLNGENESLKSKHKKWAVCQVIRFWMRRYGNEFKRNGELRLVLKKLQSDVEDQMRDIIDFSNVHADEQKNRTSTNLTNNVVETPTRKDSLAFQEISAKEIAEQLTYLEYKVLRRIPFSEWVIYARTAKLKETPQLERYVSSFNGLSRWVQAMVLNFTTPQERGYCIRKFQEVARHLKDLQNYNGLMAVTGALTNTCIARLHVTNNYIPKITKEYIKLLTEFLSSSGNYSTYRKKLNSCNGFYVPVLEQPWFFASQASVLWMDVCSTENRLQPAETEDKISIQMKDLIALHTALPDFFGGRLINVHKMMRMAAIFSKVLLVRKVCPPIKPDTELINLLRVSLQPRFTEDELYELSLAREPRTSSCSNLNSLKRDDSMASSRTLFADWAAGADPGPDPRVMERHVTAMVEAVFRFYDKDKDGSISVKEFDAIASNFPFMDSFGVLDVNCDGVISKEEMKNYFMKVNCQELSREFSHNFQETTYFTPTFCDHCAGMLWGIIKQGFRCKDCHINCHKTCKAEVVVECRDKPLPHASHSFSTIDKAAQKAEVLRNKWKNKKKNSGDSPRPLNGESECVTVPAMFYDRLLKAEEARDALLHDNQRLAAQLAESNQKLELLQAHLSTLRQQTVTFILEQMDALQMQKDTEV